MKEASDWVALIRLIMYDIIGLLVPGLILLLLIVWISGWTPPVWFAGLGGTTQVAAQATMNLVAAYILGYLLQAVSYVHLELLRPLGLFLLHKKKEPATTTDAGISAATTLTRTYFAGTAFYKMAREQIAKAVGISDFEKLTYSDVENLAFSIAPDEADKARHFRFRGDLCGALSTLALFGFLGMVISAWKYPARVNVYWPVSGSWVIWVALLVIVIGCPKDWLNDKLRQKYGQQGQEKKIERVVGRMRIVLVLVALGGMVGLAVWSIGRPPLSWGIPGLLGAWFFFLHRSFFYKDIGSRVVFYIGLAEIARQGRSENESRQVS